ncbi:protein PIMREG isoform X1 [Canis aureus]
MDGGVRAGARKRGGGSPSPEGPACCPPSASPRRVTPLPGSTPGTPAPARAACAHWGPGCPADLPLASSPASGGPNRRWTRPMASKWPGVGASGRQDREQLQEPEVVLRAPGHPDISCGALGSLCRQFQRRLPLRAVSLNLGAGPSWKRLESPEPGQQGLQAAARSAKNALGAVSQRIQESCQSGTRWLVETQVKARRRRGPQKGSSPPAHSLSQKGSRLPGTVPAYLSLGPWEDCHRPSAHGGPRAYPGRRFRRDAALRSPYSSTEPLCSPSESDSDLEPVGAGLQHLRKLSQELDEAIVAAEGSDMTVSLIRD